MKYLFVAYPKCSTCQKAKMWLDENRVLYQERHIVNENPTVEELREWYHRSGLPLKRFFNTSGNAYKELNLKEKLDQMPEEEQLELLSTNGMLVKRPILVGENFVYPGFREQEWQNGLDR